MQHSTVAGTAAAFVHVQVEREKRRLAAIAAAEAKAKQQQSWLGWLTGATPKVQAPEGDELGLRGDFSPEEAAKLQELVDEREHAIKAGDSRAEHCIGKSACFE